MFDSIPKELQERKQWVCWTLEARGNKTTKIPRNPEDGSLASVTSPETWSSFEHAVDAAMQAGFDGIGFVFTADDPYIGIDVDGEIDISLVEWFDSYAEKTQSGNGLHIILKGQLDDNRRSSKYEIYDRTRFFVMTGDVLHDKPIQLADPEKLREFLDVFPDPAAPISDNHNPGEPAMDDVEVLRAIERSSQCHKFEKLFNGDWANDYPSQSDADAALLSILRFWTGGHRAQTIRLFSQSQLASRDKWLRPDYQNRSWNAINFGPVRDLQPTTSIRVPAFLKNKVATPEEQLAVRDVLEQEVRDALSGTVIETLVRVLERVTDPVLPLELTLPKAYVLAGGALTGRSSNPIRAVHGGRGVDLSSVIIDTAGGQACNIYALTIAESASGKDVGSLVARVCAKKGWSLGGTGSAEGFLDVLSEKPVAVMEIGEFQNWLDQRHWQSKAAPTVTDIFNKYWFEVHLSQRGEGNKARQSNYCALSIAANVQPGVVHRFADRLALDSGFLNRFLLCQCRDNSFRYPQKMDPQASVKLIEDALKPLEALNGKIHIDMRDKFGHLVEEFKDAPFAPHWKRLINEYGPRLALMMTPQSGRNPAISDDGIRRACVLIRWHYHQALNVLKWFEKDDHKWEKFVLRVFKAIQGPGGSTKTGIAHKVGGTARQRNEALQELEERGFVQKKGQEYKVIEEPKEWR